MAARSARPCDFSLLELTIRGRSFLWHMVRCLVTVLVSVGRRLEEPAVVRALLDIEANPG
jgi:tRNA pseudouridine38/39 synthase